jgi:hypothetical protein
VLSPDSVIGTGDLGSKKIAGAKPSDQTLAVAILAQLTCARPLPNNGGGQTAPDLCCAAAKVCLFPTSACGRQQPGGKMSRVLARVLKQFLPVFSTAFECF